MYVRFLFKIGECIYWVAFLGAQEIETLLQNEVSEGSLECSIPEHSGTKEVAVREINYDARPAV